MSAVGQPTMAVLMGLRSTKWDENPPKYCGAGWQGYPLGPADWESACRPSQRIFNGLQEAFDRAAGFQRPDAPGARCNEPVTAPGNRFVENKWLIGAVTGEPALFAVNACSLLRMHRVKLGALFLLRVAPQIGQRHGHQVLLHILAGFYQVEQVRRGQP
jgi:hypothetical protein